MTKRNTLDRSRSLINGLESKLIGKEDSKKEMAWACRSKEVNKLSKKLLNDIEQMKANVVAKTTDGEGAIIENYIAIDSKTGMIQFFS